MICNFFSILNQLIFKKIFAFYIFSFFMFVFMPLQKYIDICYSSIKLKLSNYKKNYILPYYDSPFLSFFVYFILFVFIFSLYLFYKIFLFFFGLIYFIFITIPVFFIHILQDPSTFSLFFEDWDFYLEMLEEKLLMRFETIINIFADFLYSPFIYFIMKKYLCVFGPLFASISSGFLGRFLEKKYVIFLTIFFLGISFFLSLDFLIFYVENSYLINFPALNIQDCLNLNNFVTIFFNMHPNTDLLTATLFTWFDYGMETTFFLLFDNLSVIMVFIVITVSTLVHLYSIEYMSNDPHFFRFFSYLSAFTFFMLIMVTASNFIQLFIGWEGIGVLSMLLINFWFTRVQANKSALKAVLVNRIGDIFLLIGMGFSLYFFETLNFDVLNLLIQEFSSDMYIQNYNHFYSNSNMLHFFGITLLIASLVKSAQIGFYIWLPDAMEGPTPVSALLHAATMVTAGVYLLLRFSFLFEQLPTLLYWLSVFSMFTSLFAGLVALYQYDIKKIIAYSTCSQLAMMFVAISISKYSLGFFHLFTHAWFKALLFLTAGAVIHALNGEQDLRRMGGLLNILPLAAFSMFIGTLAIIGFPLLSGYFSKENILFSIIIKSAYSNIDLTVVFFFFLFTSLLTALYSFRVFFLTFFRLPNGFKYVYFHIHSTQRYTLFVLAFLSLLSVFSGYFFQDLFFGYGSLFFDNSFFSFYLNENQVVIEYLPSYLKHFLFISCLFLFVFMYFFYTKGNVSYYNISFWTYISYLLINFKLFINHFFVNIKNSDYIFNLIYGSDFTQVSNPKIKFVPIPFPDYKNSLESKPRIYINPLIVYYYYNSFLLNNIINKCLYFFIDKGQYIFSLVLDRYYLNFLTYYYKLIALLMSWRVFVNSFLGLRAYLFSVLLFFVIFIFSFFYLDNFYLTYYNFFNQFFVQDTKG